MNCQVIPAAPGWFVLAFYEEGAGFCRDPIIAWMFEDGVPVPITCEGDCRKFSGGYAIEAPAGRDRFCIPHNCAFETLEGLLKYWRQRS